MTKTSVLSAALKGKCPRCRQGNMFTHGTFVLGKMTSMPHQCSVCGLQFEVEPGFYFGAMFVSYAFSVAVLLANMVVLYYLFEDPEIWVYITSVSITSLLLYPLIFRYSRIIFLYLFGGVKYDSRYTTTQTA
ncbi:MAG: DUF983 domain-containing protein [Cyclobacteriaceae bacterium]